MKIIRNQSIEDLAQARLIEFQRATGWEPVPPVPIDLVAERILGLDFLWDSIDEMPGETILGGLKAKDRLIVLNEKHRDLFEMKPGLERSTKGHEMGHWDLFIDKLALDHPNLFGGDDSPFSLRSTPDGEVEVIKQLESTPEGRETLAAIRARADEPDEARAVNRYAAALSMPPALLRAEAQKVDRTVWRNLYRLAERFDVTISAMVVRLQQMDLLFVGAGRKLYASRDAASGQGTFRF